MVVPDTLVFSDLFKTLKGNACFDQQSNLFFLGLDYLTSSLGLMFMLQGIGSIIGAPMVGAIYDAVGSFDAGFYIAGGIFVAASFFSFAAQAIHKRKNPAN